MASDVINMSCYCCRSGHAPGTVHSCCLCISLRTGALSLGITFLLLSVAALCLSLLEYGASVPALIASEAAAALFYAALLLAALLRARKALLVWLVLQLLLTLALCACAALIVFLSVNRGFRHDVGLSFTAIIVAGK